MDTFRTLLEIGLPIIALIAYVVRIEMKLKGLCSEFEECKEESDACRIDQTRRYEVVREKLDALLEDVGWIRGYLKNGKQQGGNHVDQ